MATILDRIVEHKKLEVDRRKGITSLEQLMDTEAYDHPRRSFCKAIENSEYFGIITEFKRKSPSQDDINLAADPAAIAKGYVNAGAAAISCLTDTNFFGAKPSDIDLVRKAVNAPVLRKDFIVSSYQIHEARAMGADAILLIASCLTAERLDRLANIAGELGLQVLCEVHDEEDIAKISPDVDMVGVNNRNLNDFSVSIETSLRLLDYLPPGIMRISESGLDDPQSVVKLMHAGYDGFLIGTHFMRQPDPGAAAADFIRRVAEINDLYDGAIA